MPRSVGISPLPYTTQFYQPATYGVSTPTSGPSGGSPGTSVTPTPASVASGGGARTPQPITWAYAGGSMVVRYRGAGSNPNPQSITIPSPPLTIDLSPGDALPITPNSVRFTLHTALTGSTTDRAYIDRDGRLYYDIDPDTGAGTEAGTIDYATGIATVTDYPPRVNAATLRDMVVTFSEPRSTELFFRTPGAPLRPGSLLLRATAANGDLLTASADNAGVITGTDATGVFNSNTGVVQIAFNDGTDDREIFPNTALYNVVVYSFLPLDPTILGLDPVRLPLDGTVPIFERGDVVVIHQTYTTDIGTPNPNQVINLGQTDLQLVFITDVDDKELWTSEYTIDLDTGVLTMDAALNLTGFTAPFTVHARHEDMALLTDVRIDGSISIARPLSHDYDTTAYVSTALLMSTLQARVANIFDQVSWTVGDWQNVRVGDNAASAFNDTAFPLVVTNQDCINERWAFLFRSNSTVDIIGESVGVVQQQADITQVIAPLNPNTGNPYFTIQPGAWGGGWIPGNLVRMNTFSANYPVWFNRTIKPGPVTAVDDRVIAQFRGDAN